MINNYITRKFKESLRKYFWKRRRKSKNDCKNTLQGEKDLKEDYKTQILCSSKQITIEI